MSTLLSRPVPRLILALCLLLPPLLGAATPATAQAPEPPIAADSAGNLVAGTPVPPDSPTTVQPAADPSILCFSAQTSPDYDPCVRVQRLFSSVTVVRSVAAFPASLAPYQVIFFGYGESAALNSLATRLQAFTSNGGGWVVEQPNQAGAATWYPAGFELEVTSVSWPGYPAAPPPFEFTAAGAVHPMFAGLSPADLPGNFDIVPISSVGPNWSVLAKSTGYPHAGLLAGMYGSGRMVFESGNIDDISIDGGSDAFVRQMLLWAGSPPTPAGPDMQVNALEVTQGVQDLNNSVDLVANKRTYVRVHVSSPVNVTTVTANLSAKRGTTQLNPTLVPGNPGASITVRTSPNRGQINDSFWFELPVSWTAAGTLSLTARLDPLNAKNDPNPANNVMSVNVNLVTSAPLRLRIVDVQYTSGGTTYLASTTHLEHLESWLRRAYPIPSLQVNRQNYIYPDPGLPNVDTLNTRLAFIKLIRQIFTGEDSRVVYYGMVDDGGGFMRGKAAGIPSTVAAGPTGTNTWGWDFDGSYGDWYGGHEIAHTRGRFHAMFCGAGGGAAYPYPNGQISPLPTGATAIYGFDVETRAIYGPDWYDVMTYCSNEWLSDFTYEGIRSYLASLGLMAAQAEAAQAEAVQANEFLVVSGLAYLSSMTVKLDSVYQIQQNGTVPLPVPGDWTLALVDGQGVDLATYKFAPDELTDAEESPGRPAVIAEVVPWTPGTLRVEIRYGSQVLASQSASANRPTVQVTAPKAGSELRGQFQVQWLAGDPDGDRLTFTVLHSHDGGQAWDVLASGLSGNELTLDSTKLPGGANQIKVLASDGFWSGEGTSGTFYTPANPPQVSIQSPAEGAIFYAGQAVKLQGSAYDLQDGTPPDSAFKWKSNLDGDLGTGPLLDAFALSTGTHVVTLSVTNSNNQVGTATRTFQVVSGDTPVPNTLDISPFELGVSVMRGAPAETRTLTLQSAADSTLNWTVEGGQPGWLKLGANAGTTPGTLAVTFDPTGLPAGVYSAILKFNAAGASNSPVSVPVVLQITLPPHRVYLPMVQRN